ncbi:MAG: SPOR domain-containing protein [Xanthomonadales bacterium]|nr:SPOR domain-containing protein [Xanthomonadales bacterium]
MNTRLLGAAVLIALAVLFVPMFFSRTPPAGGDQSISLAIPPSPDGELQTRTMSLNPQVPSTVAAASARSATPVPSDQLATVNIGSNRPLDVETDPRAGKPHEPTTVTMGSGTSPSQPVIPMQGATPNSGSATPAATPAAPRPAAPTPKAAAPAAASAAPAAGDGNYLVNLGAYANASNVASLRREVQALGYPSSTQVVTLGGKQLTQVAAGPFETRTAAEAARLKIGQKVQGVRPTLDRGAAAPQAAPAAATASNASAAKAGGWAVQLAALSNEADANALRDKLRAGGFDGYVNPVRSGSTRLWQVRAGPLTQHADAERVQAQIKAKLGIDGVIRRVP